MKLNRWKRIFGPILLAAFFGFAFEAVASTEPDPKLMEAAKIVVTGTVSAVKSETIRRENELRDGRPPTGASEVSKHTLTVRLESAEKGRLRPVKEGEFLTLTVHWRYAALLPILKLPVPEKGDRCRFYLTEGEKPNVWRPLSSWEGPGIEILEKAPKPPGKDSKEAAGSNPRKKES